MITKQLIWVIATALTLAPSQWVWISMFGWLCLVWLFWYREDYALYTIFFFSAFFHPFGFFSNPLLTIKHFHIVIVLTAGISLLRGRFKDQILQGWKSIRFFFPFLIIILLVLLAPHGPTDHGKAFKTTANVCLIILMILYSSGIMKNSLHQLKNSILAFVWGIGFWCFSAFVNLRMEGAQWIEEHLVHNNHVGIISTIAFYYGFSLLLVEKSFWKRIGIEILACFIFLAAIMSCSRTAWFSFIMGYAMLLDTALRYWIKDADQKRFVRLITCMPCFMICLVILAMSLNLHVFQRIINFQNFIDPWSWHQIFYDKQNFGMFGILRLKQIYVIIDILKNHPITGVGFTHQVTDFHGLYLVILGGGGICSFLLFLHYCHRLIKTLLNQIRTTSSLPDIRYLQTAALSALMVWLTASIMETLFLQFSIWINLLIATKLCTITRKE